MPQNRSRWPKNASGGEFGMEMPDPVWVAHVANGERHVYAAK